MSIGLGADSDDWPDPDPVHRRQAGGRRPRAVHPLLLVLAIVCDATAVIGLGVVILGGQFGLSSIGSFFIGGLFVPVVIAGAVLSSVALVRALRARGVPRYIGVTVAALLSAATLVVGPLGMMLGAAITPNPARDATGSLRVELEHRGGRQLCASGDPGFGPDNTQPWYSATYLVPGGASLGRQLIASDAGRDVGLSRDRDAEVVDSTGAEKLVGVPQGDDGAVVSVRLSSSGGAADCDGVDPRTVPAGQRLVTVSAKVDDRFSE